MDDGIGRGAAIVLGILREVEDGRARVEVLPRLDDEHRYRVNTDWLVHLLHGDGRFLRATYVPTGITLSFLDVEEHPSTDAAALSAWRPAKVALRKVWAAGRGADEEPRTPKKRGRPRRTAPRPGQIALF